MEGINSTMQQKPLLRFKDFFQLLYESSPKDKIQKFKISDPFLTQFIFRYSDEIKWAQISSSDDIKKFVETNLLPDLKQRLQNASHPKTVLYSKDNIDVAKEIELVRQAHPEHYDNIKKLQKEKGDDEIKTYIADVINKDKLAILNTWLYRLNENIEDPIIKYLVLKPIFDSTDSSKKKTPKPYIWSAVKSYLQQIEANPKELKNLSKVYDQTLGAQLKMTERFKKIPSDNLVWIKIPGQNEDSANFENNIDTLMGLSHNSWCISGKTMASRYLNGDGAFYLLLDNINNKPTALMAIRMHRDEIQEIRGEADGQKFDPVEMEQHLITLQEAEGLNKYTVWKWINKERRYRELEPILPNEITQYKEELSVKLIQMIKDKWPIEDEDDIRDEAENIISELTFSDEEPKAAIQLGNLENVADELDDKSLQYYFKGVEGGFDDLAGDIYNISDSDGDAIMTSQYNLSDILQMIRDTNYIKLDEPVEDADHEIIEIASYHSNDEPYSFLTSVKNAGYDLEEIGGYELEEAFRNILWAYSAGISRGIENKMGELVQEHISDNFVVLFGDYLEEKIFGIPVDEHVLQNYIDGLDVLDFGNFDVESYVIQDFKDNYFSLDLGRAWYDHEYDLEAAKETYRNI
jgi:hypothetical protein